MWQILELTLKLMWRSIAFTCNLFARLLGQIFFGVKLKRIEKGNQAKRGVAELREPLAVSQLLSPLSPNGKVVISGGGVGSAWRNVLAVEAGVNISRRGTAVIVLHTGNRDLVARLQNALEPSRLRILDCTNRSYDPLRDLTVQESVQVLTDPMDNGRENLENAKIYLKGLILSAKYCRKKQPTLYILRTLSALSYAKIQGQLQQCLDTGRITQGQYDEVEELLMTGLSGRTGLNNYLDTLSAQLRDVAVDSKSVPDSQITSIGRAVRDGKVLTLDLQGADQRRLCYGVVVGELNKAIAKYGGAYLIVDDLAVMESPDLYQALALRRPELGVCISAGDLYARCMSSAEKMNDIVSGNECCIVFRHDEGRSAKAWQERFSTYKKTDTSWSMIDGLMKPSPFAMFGGSSRMQNATFTEKDEFRVLAKNIQELPEGVVYATRASDQTILHCALWDT